MTRAGSPPWFAALRELADRQAEGFLPSQYSAREAETVLAALPFLLHLIEEPADRDPVRRTVDELKQMARQIGPRLLTKTTSPTTETD